MQRLFSKLFPRPGGDRALSPGPATGGGQGHGPHASGPGQKEQPGALGKGGAGGDHVVDEEDRPAPEPLRAAGGIRPQQIGPAGNPANTE